MTRSAPDTALLYVLRQRSRTERTRIWRGLGECGTLHGADRRRRGPRLRVPIDGLRGTRDHDLGMALGSRRAAGPGATPLFHEKGRACAIAHGMIMTQALLAIILAPRNRIAGALSLLSLAAAVGGGGGWGGWGGGPMSDPARGDARRRPCRRGARLMAA